MDKKIRLVKLNRQRKFDKFAPVIRLGMLLFFVMANVSANALSSNIGETRQSKALENRISIADNSSNEQQGRKVTGKVSDSKGATLPGVSVVLKGTTIGTITDANGVYSLSGVSDKAILEFSFVGMKKVDIAVGNKAAINVSLEDETIGLEEVVAVGYGKQKKENLTGSVAVVNSKELESRPVSNAGQALQGLVSGLDISQSGGYLENKPSFNIRGMGSIGGNSSNSPLVLVDGMEDDINNVNPNDIENISVLKDAAAASIYGSKAANGVILVTTKKGKDGKVRVNYNSNFRSSSPIRVPESLDSYTWSLMINQGMMNRPGASQPFIYPAVLQRVKDRVEGKSNIEMIPDSNNPNMWDMSYQQFSANTNWYDVVYNKSAPSQDHSFSITGGTDKVNFYLSSQYLGETGIVKLGGENFNRYNINAKIEGKIAKWATVGYNLKYTREDYDAPSYLNGQQIAYMSGYNFWPIVPVKDQNGYYIRNDVGSSLMMMDGGRKNHQIDWTTHLFNVTLEPMAGWKIFANVNVQSTNSFYHSDTQIVYNHDVLKNPFNIDPSNVGSVNESGNFSTYIAPNVYSEYSKSFKDHNFKIMGGFQSEIYKSKGLSAGRIGIMLPSKPTINTTSGLDASGKAQPPSVGDYINASSNAGYFGRINYNYKEKYLLEANVRYDGSSNASPDARWQWFSSYSGGYNIAKEDFFNNIVHYINTLKIRASYGELGNSQTNGNLYLSTMPTQASGSGWLLNGAKPNVAYTPGLLSKSITWEKKTTYDIGVDLGFLNNRLTVTADLYRLKTTNQISQGMELPAVLGTGAPLTNVLASEDNGFEMDLTWKDKLINELQYSVKFILSNNRTKILKYPNPTNDLGRYREGTYVGEIWGYTTVGIAKNDQEMTDHLTAMDPGGTKGNQSTLGTNWKAGDIMYKDVNGDGVISSGAYTTTDHGDLSVIGNSTPRFKFGFDLNAAWKGFDIRVFLQGVAKRDFMPWGSTFWGYEGNGGSEWGTQIQKVHMDYFRNDPNDPLGVNLNSYYPRPIIADSKNEQAQSKYVQNAAYLRVKNLQIGYTIPQLISNRVGLEKVRVYLSGENLFTFTKLSKLYDPELLDYQWGNGNVYPFSEVLAAGISINF